ncbi:MAG: acyl carrier protein [Bacteroidales bacterium]|jgi:acyl carrier protein|nr:acyl carrier protein [Bacteroidales bacterium]MBR5831910.1 acyl carrier protein [Bacteroidales bacterium]
MTRQDLENKIIELVADKLGISNSEITMEADFRRDLSADSLDVSELIMSLENEFSIRVPESDMVNLKTVGNVVDYIEKVINL